METSSSEGARHESSGRSFVRCPSVALRSTNLRVMGSGQGSVAAKAIVAELPRLADEIVAGRIPVDVMRVPLAEVERAWNAPAPADRRVVLVT